MAIKNSKQPELLALDPDELGHMEVLHGVARPAFDKAVPEAHLDSALAALPFADAARRLS